MPRLPSPVQALLATSAVALLYLGPWLMGSMSEAPEAPEVQVFTPPPRVVLVQLAEEPPQEDFVEDAPAEPEPPAPEPEATPEPAEPVLEVADAEEIGPAGELDGPEVVPGMVRGPLVARGARDAGRAERLAEARRRSAARRAARVRRAPKCEPDRADIAKVSETAFRVEDRLINYYTTHIAETDALAIAYWAKDDDGEHRGVTLRGMRCGTVLHQAGFKNGDVLLAVNGRGITSWAEAMQAYLSLRPKNILWVDVERRGEPLRLDYVLVRPGGAEAIYPEGNPLADPTALVEAELAIEDLGALRRGIAHRRLKREVRRAGRQAEPVEEAVVSVPSEPR